MQRHARAPARDALGEAEGSLNILLVEDTRGERLLLEAFLRGQGHEVLTAEHGAQAMELFDEDAIDLVLMDVAMPVVDGIEATRRLKARCRDRWVPVILISDPSATADEMRALAAGADDYLYKPISLALLSAKLRSFQRIAQATRSLAHHRREAQAETALAAAMLESISRHHQAGLRDPALTWVVHASDRFSGDVVAAARTPSGSLVAMLGDATGHGLPAAISLLPMLQVFYGMARKDLRLCEVASEMNRQLKEYAPVGIYLAAALVAVHPRERRVEIWNGGIPGGVWLRNGQAQAAQPLASRHLPLGILDDAQFDPECVTADTGRGERILFFSDGLVEARSPGGEPFGQARLLAHLDAVALEEGFARALQAVEDHLAGRPAHDDISLMMIALDRH
jgi:CheY-like chemotaxis protein